MAELRKERDALQKRCEGLSREFARLQDAKVGGTVIHMHGWAGRGEAARPASGAPGERFLG